MAIPSATRQTKISSFFTKIPSITTNFKPDTTQGSIELHTRSNSTDSADRLGPSTETPFRTPAAAGQSRTSSADPEDFEDSDRDEIMSVVAGTSSSMAAAMIEDPLGRTQNHGRFSVTPIVPATMTAFQRLLKTVLPVAYPARFFNDIIADHSALGRVAIWLQPGSGEGEEPLVIGGIRAQLQDIDGDDSAAVQPGKAPAAIRQDLYVQTLGVLAPYRGQGVATRLLEAVIEEAQRAAASAQAGGVTSQVVSVYAHVWQESEDSLAWYRHCGFEVEELLENYYRKLRPAGAWIVRKKL